MATKPIKRYPRETHHQTERECECCGGNVIIVKRWIRNLDSHVLIRTYDSCFYRLWAVIE